MTTGSQTASSDLCPAEPHLAVLVGRSAGGCGGGGEGGRRIRRVIYGALRSAYHLGHACPNTHMLAQTHTCNMHPNTRSSPSNKVLWIVHYCKALFSLNMRNSTLNEHISAISTCSLKETKTLLKGFSTFPDSTTNN